MFLNITGVRFNLYEIKENSFTEYVAYYDKCMMHYSFS